MPSNYVSHDDERWPYMFSIYTHPAGAAKPSVWYEDTEYGLTRTLHRVSEIVAGMRSFVCTGVVIVRWDANTNGKGTATYGPV